MFPAQRTRPVVQSCPRGGWCFWRPCGFWSIAKNRRTITSSQGGLNVPTPTAPADRQAGLEWDFTSRGFAKGAIALSSFAVLYSMLVALGLFLHENVEALTIMWPAAGLLFMALWLRAARRWIWILSLQVTIELLAGVVKSDHFSSRDYLPL